MILKNSLVKVSVMLASGLAVFLVLAPLLSLNGKIFIIKSGSMAPTIEKGALVFIREEPDYLPGDVITFESANGLVTHRIVAVKNDAYQTQGDANNVQDPGMIKKESIMGAVAFSLPYLGYLFSFKETALGFVSLIALPVGVLVALEIQTMYWAIKQKRYATS